MKFKSYCVFDFARDNLNGSNRYHEENIIILRNDAQAHIADKPIRLFYCSKNNKIYDNKVNFFFLYI